LNDESVAVAAAGQNDAGRTGQNIMNAGVDIS